MLQCLTDMRREMLIVPLAVASASLSIEKVALQNNSLTSTIPEAFGLLTNLSKLSLNRAMCGLSSANLILFLILSTYILQKICTLIAINLPPQFRVRLCHCHT